MWRVGDSVAVQDIEANQRGTQDTCNWTGSGVIDMIQHGGDYIRVVGDPYYAWIERQQFNRVTKAGETSAAPSSPLTNKERSRG